MRNMKVIGAFVFSTITGCLFSCSGALEQKAFIRWVTDYENGLHVKRECGDLVLDVQFNPVDYMWLQRTGGMKTEEPPLMKEEFAGMQYYTLTIRMKDAEGDLISYGVRDEAEKQKRIYYYSYLFQDDIQLEDSGKLLPCVLFHFERPADLKQGRTFLLAFESPFAESEEAKLIIKVPHFSSLPVKIKVSKKNIPALAI